MNFYRELGELIFGTRLKRISDRFLIDVGKIYESLGIRFEPSWFPLFYLLDKRGELSVTEIAEELEITHSAISQMAAIIEKKSLLKFSKDKFDKRKRLVCLTEKGFSILEQVKPVWQSIQRNMQDLLEDGPNSAYLLQALDETEAAMDKQSLSSRVVADFQKRQLEHLYIVPYDSKYKVQFKKLMLSWLLDNYNSDVLNVDLINYPEKQIISNGGLILMVKIGDEIVGTIVAQLNEKTKSDILYLVVDEHWRKRKIGKRLLSEIIRQLRLRGIKDIRIELDRKLTPAINLFKSVGFEFKAIQADPGSVKANQASLTMGLTLS